MFKMNSINLTSEEVYVKYGEAYESMNGKTVYKTAPRFYIYGIDTYQNRKFCLMIEAFISKEELNGIKTNEELKLNQYVTDLVFWNGDVDSKFNIFDENIMFLDFEDNELSIVLKKTKEDKLILDVCVPELDVLFNDEIEM